MRECNGLIVPERVLLERADQQQVGAVHGSVPAPEAL